VLRTTSCNVGNPQQRESPSPTTTPPLECANDDPLDDTPKVGSKMSPLVPPVASSIIPSTSTSPTASPVDYGGDTYTLAAPTSISSTTSVGASSFTPSENDGKSNHNHDGSGTRSVHNQHQHHPRSGRRRAHHHNNRPAYNHPQLVGPHAHGLLSLGGACDPMQYDHNPMQYDDDGDVPHPHCQHHPIKLPSPRGSPQAMTITTRFRDELEVNDDGYGSEDHCEMTAEQKESHLWSKTTICALLSELNIGSKDDETSSKSPKFTAMLRNIPNKYTRKMLIDQLEEGRTFRGDYDYVYVPIDFTNKCNVGYAFINFRTLDARNRFQWMFNEKEVREVLPGFNSKKVCRVTDATVQGVQLNLAKIFGSIQLMKVLKAHPQWRPYVVNNNNKPVSWSELIEKLDSNLKDETKGRRSERGTDGNGRGCDATSRSRLDNYCPSPPGAPRHPPSTWLTQRNHQGAEPRERGERERGEGLPHHHSVVPLAEHIPHDSSNYGAQGQSSSGGPSSHNGVSSHVSAHHAHGHGVLPHEHHRAPHPGSTHSAYPHQQHRNVSSSHAPYYPLSQAHAHPAAHCPYSGLPHAMALSAAIPHHSHHSSFNGLAGAYSSATNGVSAAPLSPPATQYCITPQCAACAAAAHAHASQIACAHPGAAHAHPHAHAGSWTSPGTTPADVAAMSAAAAAYAAAASHGGHAVSHGLPSSAGAGSSAAASLQAHNHAAAAAHHGHALWMHYPYPYHHAPVPVAHYPYLPVYQYGPPEGHPTSAEFYRAFYDNK